MLHHSTTLSARTPVGLLPWRWWGYAKHCKTLQHAATLCNTLQHSAIRCNTLQHAATHRISNMTHLRSQRELQAACYSGNRGGHVRVHKHTHTYMHTHSHTLSPLRGYVGVCHESVCSCTQTHAHTHTYTVTLDMEGVCGGMSRSCLHVIQQAHL